MDRRQTPGLLVRLALAALGGALFASATPPLRFVLGPVLGFACLAEALGRTRTRPLHAALAGTLFGFVVHALALPSLGAVFVRFGGLSTAEAGSLAVLTWLLQALPYALAGVASAWFCPVRDAEERDPAWWVLPLCVTASCALTPQLFPWQPGALLVDVPWLVQSAELGGAAAVSLGLCLSAAALWEIARTRSIRPALLLTLALCLLAPALLGPWRIRTLREERVVSLRVGVVQPNMPVVRMRDEAGRQLALANLRTLTSALEQQRVDITFWGESAFPFPLSRARRTQPVDGRRIVGGPVEGPVLTGVITHTWVGSERRETNSAWLVTKGGELGARVDKEQLVPFAEYVPRGPALDFLGVRARGALFPGRGGSIPFRGQRLGVLICYEDLFAQLARARVLDGADVLVNLTNDVWFGAAGEPALHERMARLRAVETRRELLRVTNTGVSSHVAATGEPLTLLPANVATSFVAELSAHRGLTPFVRFGDWVPYACLLALFVFRRRAQ